MQQITFRDKIASLREYYLLDRLNHKRDKDFWYIMDSISDELILKWAERASNIKNPVHDQYAPGEWTQLCNILHYMKTYDRYTQMPWSKSQKRFCTFMIIKMWDDIEMEYFC